MATYESRKYAIPGANITNIAATAVADGSVTDSEYQFINTLGSNAQTQINAKLPKSGGTMTGGIVFPDDSGPAPAKLSFGAGDDLRLFSDGSTAFLKGNDIRVVNSSNAQMIKAASAGAVDLSHNGTTRLSTTGSGATVVGTLSATTVSATTVTGAGSGLTSLNASNISSGTISSARLPGGLGKVLQVVSTNSTTVFSTNSSSFVDVTGMSVSITPSSTSSKVLVLVDYCADTYNNNTIYGLRLNRSGSAIGGGAQGNQVIQLNANSMKAGGFNFLDSPSSTSSRTYKLQVATRTHAGGNNGTIRFNQNPDAGNPNKWASNIIAIEIGT